MSQKTLLLQPTTLVIPANQHTNGDGDFDGHGPMMYLNVALYVANEYQIGMNCSVRFEETTSDWTTWQGAFNGIVADIRTQGDQVKITGIATPAFTNTQQLNGYGTHHFDFGIGGIVNSIDAIGDSDGGFGGADDKPQVTLNFNSILVNVQDPPAQQATDWFRTRIPQLQLVR